MSQPRYARFFYAPRRILLLGALISVLNILSVAGKPPECYYRQITDAKWFEGSSSSLSFTGLPFLLNVILNWCWPFFLGVLVFVALPNTHETIACPSDKQLDRSRMDLLVLSITFGFILGIALLIANIGFAGTAASMRCDAENHFPAATFLVGQVVIPCFIIGMLAATIFLILSLGVGKGWSREDARIMAAGFISAMDIFPSFQGFQTGLSLLVSTSLGFALALAVWRLTSPLYLRFFPPKET